MKVGCVVVGGGISGLAAAHELQRQRVPFVLVERATRFGGVIRTEHVDGFVVDAGPDALLTQKRAGIALCEELGVALSPARSTRAFIAHRGRLRALPDAGVFGIPTDWKAFARSRAFSPVGKLRMAGEYFVPPALPVGDESIASFITRRFGREALSRLGEPLLAGIHGGDAARLSMRALFPRFLDLERSDGSVIRGLRRLRRNSAMAPGAPFVSVRGGTEALVTALVASFPAASLISDVQVSHLEWRGEWRVHLANGRHIDAPAVLLATPPATTADLVQSVDPGLSGLLGRIRDVPLITVALGYRREDVCHPLAGSGFVVPKGEGASVNAVTWMSSKWMERAPADGVLLRASVGGARHPDAACWSNADALIRVRDDVRRYLHITAPPVFARVYRMPHAGVQLDVGHLPLIERLEARVSALPGVFISAAGIRGVGIADCVGDARAQAIAATEYVRCLERHHASAAGG
jgi:oxygen-dependent protoporphyrinogen oxidase